MVPGECSAGMLLSGAVLVLADVTVVVYDEVGHAIYTGNHAGHVHKWGVGT
jgi:hypothetical protein